MKKARPIILITTLSGLCLLTGLSYPQDEGPRVIPIVARRFAFSPRQITLKKGETVQLQFTSEDVTHGFYMETPKVNEVISPGGTTEVTIIPETAGTFTAICSRVCGIDHANMSMTIVVE